LVYGTRRMGRDADSGLRCVFYLYVTCDLVPTSFQEPLRSHYCMRHHGIEHNECVPRASDLAYDTIVQSCSSSLVWPRSGWIGVNPLCSMAVDKRPVDDGRMEMMSSRRNNLLFGAYQSPPATTT